MKIRILDNEFSVCKLENLDEINFNDDFLFVGKTDEEISVVCQTRNLPKNYLECENGWKAFRIEGILDFSLVGILAQISSVLANHEISIFAISTFNTDYILVKKDKLSKAVYILEQEGFEVCH
ncbi:MAG: ACT domain-containing protein [Epulopiscium sp.]|mgnify:CR=1 FL=1|nr:ACT domain-containing protein [Candidatus Epulonipiscium sp.]